MGTIITAATIMAMYLNSAGNLNSQYCYNADIENGKVTTMYVYDKDGEHLSGKLEYRYSYDVLGRVTAKEVYRRDAATGIMMPDSRYDYTYAPGGYAVERSLWNSRRNGYDSADSRTEYRMETEGVVSVSTYETADGGTEMKLVDNLLAIVPAEGGLLAGF